MNTALSARRLASHAPFWILLLLPLVLRLPDLLGLLSSDPIFFTGGIGDSGKMAGGYPWIDPNVGFQGQALGKLAADQWLSGHVPWWNSYSGVGLPLAAEAQPAAFFLPFVLLLHFRDGGVWLEVLMQVIAGVSTYALLRKLKLSELAAVTGAILFQTNGTFAWHGAPISTPVAFLPMLLLGVESLRERIQSQRPGGWWLIPLALAWSIYAGFPETAYINGLLTGVWVLTRLAGMQGPRKTLFLAKLSGAVACGVLLALPQIIPFFEYLNLSFIGGHEDAFAHASLPLAAAPLSMMPWLYGPIFQYDDPTHAIANTWGNIGGYLTALQFALVALGLLLYPRRLCFVLLCWMLVCLAKSFNISPVTEFVNLLPLIKSAAFFRYAPPSWELAGAVIAAFAVHDIQHRSAVPISRIFLAFGLTISVAAGMLWLNRPALNALQSLGGYSRFFHIALVWLVISLTVAALLLLVRRHWRHAPVALVALLVADACIAFALPLRSGVSNHHPQEDAIAFLKGNIGLQRTYTLGPLAPNYGAFFHIQQINHNYLPISRNWVDYIRRHLNPEADPVTFVGDIGRTDHSTDAARLVRDRQEAYETLGVKYVLAPAGADPFSATNPPTSQANGAPPTPFPLEGEKSAIVHWRTDSATASQKVSSLSVLIGNYENKADGLLVVKLCTDDGKTCVGGRRALNESADNQPFAIPLDQPLQSSATSSSLTATLSQEGDTQPVAIWLQSADQRQQVVMDNAPAPGIAPAIQLKIEEGQAAPKKVFSDATMTIFQLPKPKPYYEIDQGQCSVQPISLTMLSANCATASRLVRREDFYPGWYASIDGAHRAVEQSGEIFQSVLLPPGQHSIEFRYRPTHWPLILIGWLAGIAILLWGALAEARASRCLARESIKSTWASGPDT